MTILSRLVTTLAAGAFFVAAGPAFAEWPERPVTLIAVAGAGGGSDYTMRLLAREMEEATGQSFNVVNQA